LPIFYKKVEIFFLLFHIIHLAAIKIDDKKSCAYKKELILIDKENHSELTNSLDCDNVLDAGPFYHGTKADLKLGDLLQPGYHSNYGEGKKANFVYLTATLDAAVWGAELATGNAPRRIYLVEPTGSFEDDPNLTDKKFPGNPTRSYRTRYPLRVVEEVMNWQGHPPEVLKKMRDHLEELKRRGIEAIND
jgi:rifampin ADP-ribosylating transferase